MLTHWDVNIYCYREYGELLYRASNWVTIDTKYTEDKRRNNDRYYEKEEYR